MKKIRDLVVFAAIFIPYLLLRVMPFAVVRLLAGLFGWAAWCVPSLRKLVAANVQVAFPELPAAERNRIVRRSFGHMMLNLLEFFWAAGITRRVEDHYRMEPEMLAELQRIRDTGTRFIYVTPHLGSWEGEAVIATHLVGVTLAAVVKPQKNPYLNWLLNDRGRKAEKGVKVIFARGAMQASMQALKAGDSIGLLIDQNTKVRSGGVFVDFFGMPVASSRSPAVLADYCRKHDIPLYVGYASVVRKADGKNYAVVRPLSRPLADYTDDAEMVQELIAMGEADIRQYPDQYLWLYRRFQYIPEDCPEAVRARYPFYARQVDFRFMAKGGKGRALREKQENGPDGDA